MKDEMGYCVHQHCRARSPTPPPRLCPWAGRVSTGYRRCILTAYRPPAAMRAAGEVGLGMLSRRRVCRARRCDCQGQGDTSPLDISPAVGELVAKVYIRRAQSVARRASLRGAPNPSGGSDRNSLSVVQLKFNERPRSLNLMAERRSLPSCAGPLGMPPPRRVRRRFSDRP